MNNYRFTMAVLGLLLSAVALLLLATRSAEGQGYQTSPGTGDWRSSQPAANPGCAKCPATGCPPGYCARLSGGTGTLIFKDAEKGVILTAYHVVEGGPRDGIRVMMPSGEVLTAHAIYDDDQTPIVRDVSADLALLITDTVPRAEPCPIAAARPKAGDRLKINGYGGGQFGTKTVTVANYSSGGDTLIMRGEAVPGDSGGPILNSEGALVAVVSGSTWADPTLVDTTMGGHVVPIQQLCQVAQFWAPWNARSEQERIRGDAAVEMERIRSSTPIVQPSPFVPIPTGPDPGLSGRVSSLEGKVATIEGQVDSVKTALAGAETAAGKAVADALGGPGGVAGLVTKEFEKQSPGFLEKAKSVAGGALEMIPGGKWLFGLLGGSNVLLWGLVIYVIIDVRHYIKSGGEDKLGIQHIMNLLKKGAVLTPTTIDDKGLDWVANKVDSAVDMALRRWMPPQQAAAAAPAPVAAPPAMTPQQAVAAAQAAGYVVTPPPAVPAV